MAADDPKPRTTAYPVSEGVLALRLAGARIDHPSFARRIERCDLRECRGMCCHDGVLLDDQAAGLVGRLAREEAGFFREIGLDLPPEPVVGIELPDGTVHQKTATKPCDFRGTVAGFPDHFSNTACVFHLDDGRCGLQVLSEACGLHPWHYKPTDCWLHPVSIEPGTVFLESETTDRMLGEGYPGFVSQTFCGRTEPAGRPAEEALAEELGELRKIEQLLV